MATTTRTQITKENTEFYDKTLLVRAVAYFVHTKWAQVRDIPKNGGTNRIRFRRYGNLSAATTALSEGITPAGSQLSITQLEADVLQYGDFVTITDRIDYESKDPVLMEAAEILGDQAGDTIDQLTRTVLNAGTNVQRVNDRATRVEVIAGDVIDVATVRKCVRTLKLANARRIMSQINASTGYNTDPLSAAYVGIMHPNVTFTAKGFTTGFTPIEKYAQQGSVMENEVGKIDEVRFVETTNAKVFTGEGASSIDVYSTIILAKDAYGISRISGESMKNIVKPLGSAGTGDPLDQRATSGWKATFVAIILNNDFMIRMESSAAS